MSPAARLLYGGKGLRSSAYPVYILSEDGYALKPQQRKEQNVKGWHLKMKPVLVSPGSGPTRE